MKGQSAGQKATTADPGKRPSRQSVAEAIIAAATEIGEDLRGKHGLQGYLRRLAVRHPPLFARLLSATLPPEDQRAAAIEHQGPAMILQGGMTIHDVAAAFRDRGPDTNTNGETKSPLCDRISITQDHDPLNRKLK